jgi:hypothetical protein
MYDVGVQRGHVQRRHELHGHARLGPAGRGHAYNMIIFDAHLRNVIFFLFHITESFCELKDVT